MAALALPTRHLKLQPLDKVDAFSLFCRRAFYSRKDYDCPSELLELANSIVDRCQGLPLAIVSIGSLLSSKQPIQHAWNLFNLRYIGLRRTKVKSFPETIEKLYNLHTLDIKQTKIEKLPRGIVKVRKLRHLLADRCADEKHSDFRYFTGVQPPKELSNLEELQTLETVEASKDLAEQLKKLTQLRSVWIDNITDVDCAVLFSTLSNMPLLSTLLLSASSKTETLCFKTLEPISGRLHKLIVRGHWANGTLQCPIFQDCGRNLKYLALSWCHLGEDPLSLLASHVPYLTFLRLNRVYTAKTLVLSAGCFPELKTLVLKHMPDVNKVEIEDRALPLIEGLHIVSLYNVKKVPEGIYIRTSTLTGRAMECTRKWRMYRSSTASRSDIFYSSFCSNTYSCQDASAQY